MKTNKKIGTKPIRPDLFTLLSNLFFLWVLYYFGMGGWDTASQLLFRFGFFPWIILGMVIFLILVKSDGRVDVPIFICGVLLGIWGEWWGTTRGLWQYWNGATPPIYLPPLWGIGVITVYHFTLWIFPWLERHIPQRVWQVAGLTFIILPAWGFAQSWHLLAGIDWSNKLDFHFFAGLTLAIALFFYRLQCKETLLLYLCGTLIGGAYEYLGTSWGEWTYITKEIPPLWIAPLWGYATVAMTRLALLIRSLLSRVFTRSLPSSKDSDIA